MIARQRRRRADQSRGFVLIVVLALSALAAAVAMEVAYRARVEGERVALGRERLQAELFARAGLLLAEDILRKDDASIDGARDIWAQPISISREEGAITVTISDESARFPVHKVVNERGLLDLDYKTLLGRYLSRRPGIEGSADAIADFMDADDEALPAGAESPHYGSLTPPRRAANRRIFSPAEMLLVKDLGGDEGRALSEACSYHGPGLVNINTADSLVLSSLAPSIDLSTADRIIARAQFNPFAKVSELTSVADIPAAEMTELEKVGRVASSVFRVASTGRVGSVEYTITFIVTREAGGLKILHRSG